MKYIPTTESYRRNSHILTTAKTGITNSLGWLRIERNTSWIVCSRIELLVLRRSISSYFVTGFTWMDEFLAL
jgi:hypothetical protein